MRNTKGNKKQNGQGKKQKRPAGARNQEKPKQVVVENELVDSRASYAERRGLVFWEAMAKDSSWGEKNFTRSEVENEIKRIKKHLTGKQRKERIRPLSPKEYFAGLDSRARLKALRKELKKADLAKARRIPEMQKKFENGERGRKLWAEFDWPVGGIVSLARHWPELRQNFARDFVHKAHDPSPRIRWSTVLWSELRGKCLNGTMECCARRWPDHSFAKDRVKIPGVLLQGFKPILYREISEKILGKDLFDGDVVLEGPDKTFLFDLRFVDVAERKADETPLTLYDLVFKFGESSAVNNLILIKDRPFYAVKCFQAWVKENHPSQRIFEDESVRYEINSCRRALRGSAK